MDSLTSEMAPEYKDTMTQSAIIDLEQENIQTTVPNLAQDLEFWMTRLPGRLRSIPITQLAIPGSHNTMTYTIERTNDVGPDESKILQRLGKYLSPIAKPIIFNWSINQYDTVKEQLNGGIRYLDLRVATKSNDDKIYFLHGLYGSEVGNPLREINDWLDAHPQELVILDLQHFYKFNEVRHRGLIDQLRFIFHRKMCTVNEKLNNTSLNWLTNERYQVIIIYRNPIAREYRDLWPTGLWPTPWPNTTNVVKLVNFLNEGLQNRNHEIGFVSQCLLTPSKSYVFKHICGSLHRDLNVLCHNVTIPWIDQCKSGCLNVVITDYVSYDNFSFSRVVIQRNANILK